LFKDFFEYLRIIDQEEFYVLLTGFGVTCFGCFLFIEARFISFGKFNRSQHDLSATQSAHTKTTPRLAGIPTLLGLICCFLLISKQSSSNSNILYFYISLIPTFIAGICEDLGISIPPWGRLSAITISGLLLIALGNFWIYSTGLPVLDSLLLLPILAIPFSLFAASGAVNSFNLIDGLNGLCSFTAMAIALSLSLIAIHTNNQVFGLFLLALIFSVLGFFIFNFPFGRIFLGDAGAYCLGHLLVWSSIYLMHLDGQISAFAILLIFFFPIADTLLAIWRRTKRGAARFQPDRLHFHHLVMRILEIRYFGRRRRNLTNPLASLIIFPFIIINQFLGLIFIYSHVKALVSLIISSIIYLILYFILLRFGQKLRKSPHTSV